jgi:hypothetical protein
MTIMQAQRPPNRDRRVKPGDDINMLQTHRTNIAVLAPSVRFAEYGEYW